LRLRRSENGNARRNHTSEQQHKNGKYNNAKPLSIAFHGTPTVPVAQNGRAARITRDSTTRASEDKANPVPAPSWYREPVGEIPRGPDP
jgi:hypothetical protein